MSPARHDPYACAVAWAELTSAHRVVNEALTTALASQCGLGLSAFDALVALGRAGRNGMRLNDLNEAVALSQPALSRLVSRLEQDGLVVRTHDPRDGRGVLLTLTTSGRVRLRRAAAVHTECIQTHFVSRLDDGEQRVLTGALARIRSAPGKD